MGQGPPHVAVINADATIQGRAGRLVDHIIRAGTNMTIDQAKVRMMEIDAIKINMSDTPEGMELTYNDLLHFSTSQHPHRLRIPLFQTDRAACSLFRESVTVGPRTGTGYQHIGRSPLTTQPPRSAVSGATPCGAWRRVSR